MRKLFILLFALFCLVLLPTAFTENLAAEEQGEFLRSYDGYEGELYEENGILYSIGNDTAEVAGYTVAPVYLEIPASVKGVPVSVIREGAFRECGSLERVSLPASITRLEGSAQYSVLGDSPETIQVETIGLSIEGNGAFYACTNLKSVTFSENSQLTYIGPCSFFNTDLSTIDFPESVTFIGAGAFVNNDNLEQITLPENLDSIEPFVLYDCDMLRIVETEGNAITNIGMGSFAFSHNLTTFTIPDAVQTIDGFAFFWCNCLSSVFIPQNVSQIESTAFISCHYLERIDVDSENPYYTSLDGVLYNKEMTKVVCCPGCKNGKWVVPETVRSMEPYACFGSEHLTEIVLPESLEFLLPYSFCNCFLLEWINIPQGISILPERTFLNCSALSSITIEGTLSSIGDYCFCGCGFEEIESFWPENLSVIGKGLFRANRFRTLVVPDWIEYLDEDSFSNNRDLVDVYMSDDLKAAIPIDSVFWNTQYNGFHGPCGNDATYLVKGHKLSILGTGDTYNYNPGAALCTWDSIEEIEIAEGITLLGRYLTHSLRTIIETITIPKTVKYINENFLGGTAIRSMTMLSPKCDIRAVLNCQVIYGYDDSTAEQYCRDNDVTFVSLGTAPNVDEDDEPVYTGSCGETASWRLQDHILTIRGSGAISNYEIVYTPVEGAGYMIGVPSSPWYAYQTEIFAVEIGENITEIGNRAFMGCSDLKTVSLPSSLLRLGQEAFSECSMLTSIDLPDSVKEIGECAFFRCENLSAVRLSSALTSIPGAAFQLCFSLDNVTIPEGVVSIGQGVFAHCYNLKTISIPDTVENIGFQAFCSCYALESIHLPQALTAIEGCLVLGCTALKEVTIPRSVIRIDRQAFEGCYGLETLIFEGNMPEIYKSAFSMVDTVALYPGGDSTWQPDTIEIYDGTVNWIPYTTLPTSLVEIKDEAFMNSSFRAIIIPQGCLSIGARAFAGSEDLRYVVLPQSLTQVADDAFSGCDHLVIIDERR